jgi:hypothetical protein
MLNEMAAVGKLLGFMNRRETFTEIVDFRSTFAIANGVATTKDLTLNFGAGQLTGEGTFGLADQTLNLRLSTLLGREVTAGIAPGRLGGILGSILAGPQGQIAIPTIVTGTFAQPRLAPDPDRFRMKK